MNTRKRSLVRVGVVLHPLTLDDFLQKFFVFYFPFSRILSPFLRLVKPYSLKKLCASCPPHIVFKTNVVKVGDINLQIIGAMCPLFPEQLVLDNKNSKEKILKAIALLDSNDVALTTLAGFSSIVTDGGNEIAELSRGALTTGNTLTAAMTIDGVESVFKKFNLDKRNINLSIIGATGDIGSACAQHFARSVRKMILCSRTIQNNRAFQEGLLSLRNDIIFTSDLVASLEDADVVIVATSAFGYLIDQKLLKRNAIVCDVSMPPNIRQHDSCRKDVFVFKGGRSQLPFFKEISNRVWSALFPENSVYGCLAEAIVLALDGKYVNFSAGKGNITAEKIEEIRVMANRHRITLAELGAQ